MQHLLFAITLQDVNNGFHFQVKQSDYPTDRADDDRNSKFVSEIYLTRLLKTKVSLQLLLHEGCPMHRHNDSFHVV